VTDEIAFEAEPSVGLHRQISKFDVPGMVMLTGAELKSQSKINMPYIESAVRLKSRSKFDLYRKADVINAGQNLSLRKQTADGRKSLFDSWVTAGSLGRSEFHCIQRNWIVER
jgi:hypothetical protein